MLKGLFQRKNEDVFISAQEEVSGDVTISIVDHEGIHIQYLCSITNGKDEKVKLKLHSGDKELFKKHNIAYGTWPDGAIFIEVDRE